MRWLKTLDERTPFGIKVAGAFAAIIVVGVTVVYWLLQGAMISTFEDYSAQTSLLHAQGMAPFFAYYYEQNGSWQGVERLLAAMSRAHGPSGEHLVLVGASGGVLGPTETETKTETKTEVHPGGRTLPQAALERGTPILVDGQRVGTLLVNSSPGTSPLLGERFLASIRRSIAGAGGAAAGIALILGVLVIRQLTRPLRRLSAAAHEIAAGKLDHRVEIRSRDVIEQLGEDFNTMAQKLARSEALRRRMIADIAHELRNPLTVIQGHLQGLREGVFAPTPERLTSLHEESRLLSRLVNDLQELALAEAGELKLERRPVDLPELIRRVADSMRPQLKERRVELIIETPKDLPLIEIDPDRIGQVLGNLLSNAVRYTPQGGSITVHAQQRNQTVQVRVSDTGPGIPPEDLPHVFERFWRADRSRVRKSGGSGLGLAIAKHLIQAHGGSMGVESAVGGGTTFTFHLPLAGELEKDRVVLGETPAYTDAVLFQEARLKPIDPRRTRLTRRRYDRLAYTYDVTEGLFERIVFRRWRARLWAQVRGERILEIGVGTGKNFPFYPPNAEVTAVDLSPRMLGRARRKAARMELGVELREMDAQALEFPDGTFDAVVASFVFCSVPDPVLGLQEAARVCKPDGRIVLLEHMRPEGRLWGRLFDALNPIVVRLSGANINRRTLENVRKAGLEIERVWDLAAQGIVKLIVARPSQDLHPSSIRLP